MDIQFGKARSVGYKFKNSELISKATYFDIKNTDAFSKGTSSIPFECKVVDNNIVSINYHIKDGNIKVPSYVINALDDLKKIVKNVKIKTFSSSVDTGEPIAFYAYFYNENGDRCLVSNKHKIKNIIAKYGFEKSYRSGAIYGVSISKNRIGLYLKNFNYKDYIDCFDYGTPTLLSLKNNNEGDLIINLYVI